MTITFDTPLKGIRLEVEDGKLLSLTFLKKSVTETGITEASIPFKEEFLAYLEGKRRRFTFKTDPRGTAFQREVWRELSRIPYGETVSYGEIARRIGRPKSSRAVGNAVGANPLPIVIPCHRVIKSDGSIGGFSSGLHLKRKLLSIEGIVL